MSTCGCVLAKKTLEEVPSAVCLVCARAFSKRDVVQINPPPAVREEVKARLRESKAAAGKVRARGGEGQGEGEQGSSRQGACERR